MGLPFTAEQFFGVFADYGGSAAVLLRVATAYVLLGAGALLGTLLIGGRVHRPIAHQ